MDLAQLNFPRAHNSIFYAEGPEIQLDGQTFSTAVAIEFTPSEQPNVYLDFADFHVEEFLTGPEYARFYDAFSEHFWDGEPLSEAFAALVRKAVDAFAQGRRH